MKQPNPNSNRSKKRTKRGGFLPSRCNRRAKQRLERAQTLMRAGIKESSGNDAGYTPPGALKRW